MASARDPASPPFPVGDSPADFKFEDLDISFTEQDFKGRKRANESFLSAIEKASDFLFWKSGLVDSMGTCTVQVDSSSGKITRKRNGDIIKWTGKIMARKDDATVGRGDFFATFTEHVDSKQVTMNEIYVKLYKAQRDRMRDNCVV